MNLKKNIVYSIILTLSTYLVPLVVFPYISRVLGPQGIGRIDSVDAIINYLVQLSMMGLSTLGIREVARHRNDPEQLRQAFRDLFTLNVITTVSLVTVMAVVFAFVPYFAEQRRLYMIGLSKLFFNMFWIEWFFKGLENFRYITLRSVVMRLLFIAAVFIFVRDAGDYVTYYVLWVGLVVGNALCNWCYRRRFTSYTLRGFSIRRYLSPFVLLGLFSICAAVYTQLPTAWLSARCGVEQVAFYTTSTRIHAILLALFTSLTGVMIPRMSSLLAEGHMDDAHTLAEKTFTLLFMFSFPVIIYLEFFAPDIIAIFAGPGFEGAIWPMRIVVMQIIVIGSEQILILQLLIPSGHDRTPLFCALAGAGVSVAANLLLVPHLQAVGSAVSWVLAECTVMACALFWVNRYLQIHYPWRQLLRQALHSLPYLAMALAVALFVRGMWCRTLVAGMGFLIWSGILLWRSGFIPTNLIQKLLHR